MTGGHDRAHAPLRESPAHRFVKALRLDRPPSAG